MLAGDLRKALDAYSKGDLALLAAELYKTIPKKDRESKDIDAMINDFSSYLERKKNGKAEPSPTSITTLKPQVDEFLDYAYKQYYMAPNRYVRKQDRPKWRSIASSHIKELLRHPADSEDGEIATQLLEKLYRMFGHASQYHLFPTSTPFKAIRINQDVFCDHVIARILDRSNNPDEVKRCLKVMVETPLDMYSGIHPIAVAFATRLKTTDMRERAYEKAIQLLEEKKSELAARRLKSGNYSMASFHKEEEVHALMSILFHLLSYLDEMERAIALYRKYTPKEAGKTPIRPLLQLLQACDRPSLWSREYDQAIAKGTDFGKSYSHIRMEIEKTGVFPNGYFFEPYLPDNRE